MDIGKDLQRAYDDGYEQGKQDAMRWIPVAERLPDFEGWCLCMRKEYPNANLRHQEIMCFDYDEQAFCSNVDGIFVADGIVTHWMPLPKPPEDCEYECFS